MKASLTPKQKEVFELIKSFIDEKGYSPSITELAALRKRSRTTTFQVVKLLRERGYIFCLSKKWRSIAIVE